MSEIDSKAPDWSQRYADDAVEADARYAIYKETDPFPSVAPSLLNSADLADYVSATGMICPFGEDKRKSASYGVHLKGRIIYWDEKGNKEDFIFSNKVDPDFQDLEVRGTFTLKKNAIAFVTIEPYFRLPNYMALRFNFTIRDVYRGLLLGTGPIVDPGFQGKLSIPIHNLTNNDYCFKYNPDEEFVWIEFTKLTDLDGDGEGDERPRVAKFAPFPERKLKRNSVSDYLHHAIQGQNVDNVRSSIPESIYQIQKDAAQAQKNSEQASDKLETVKRVVKYAAAVAVVTFVVAVFAVYLQIVDLVRDANDLGGKVRVEMEQLSQDSNNKFEKIDRQRKQIQTRLDSFISKDINSRIISEVGPILLQLKKIKAEINALKNKENKNTTERATDQ